MGYLGSLAKTVLPSVGDDPFALFDDGISVTLGPGVAVDLLDLSPLGLLLRDVGPHPGEVYLRRLHVTVLGKGGVCIGSS